MDQVKVYLGVAKKHHFWILVAIVIIVAIVVWLKALSTLATKYEGDKRTITGAEDSVQKVTNPEPVNASFTTKVETLHDGLKNSVVDAWKKLYDRQAALFLWPDLSDFDNNVDLNKLRPDEDIPIYIRTYFNEKVVGKQWKNLLEQVPIRKPKEQAVQADAEGSENEDADAENEEKRAVEYEGLVVWKPERREAIVSRYYTRNATPSTKRLRLAQEDVWLFESLVEVVNTVNVGATDSLKAPIKEILTLDVAQWAIAASLESGSPIWTPSARSGGTPSTGGPAMASPAAGDTAAPPGPTGMAPASSGGNAAATDNDNEWLEGRYLDEKGQPLKGTTQPFAEFDQVFVYMKFVMDQRRIPELVAACANARVPIETRQVRVQMLKADDGGLFAPGGMGGGGMGGGGMGGGGMGGGGMGGGGMGGGGMGGGGMGGGGMGGGGMGGGGMGGGGMGGGGMGGGGMGGGGMGGGGMGSGGMGSGGMGSGGMGSGGMGPGGMGSGGMGPGGMGPGGFGGMLDGGVETTVFDALVELSGVVYLYKPPDIAKLGTGAAGSPEKRSFGVPTTSVHVPGGAGGAGGMSGPMMGPAMTGSGGR